MKLKSLTAHPVGGFQAILPQCGQQKPFVGSFPHVCREVFMLIKANKYLAEKHGWVADMQWVEQFVEEQNAARMVAGGWTNFLAEDLAAPNVSAYQPAEKKSRLAAVGAVKRVAAGVRLLLDWLGSGGKPVSTAQAESRAKVCVACPMNGSANVLGYFTSKVAEKIKLQLEIRQDLDLKTSVDDKLGICTGCDCVNKLKVWTPTEHVAAHTSKEIMDRLHPKCWVRSETQLPPILKQ